MLRRIGLLLIALVVAAFALPPLWFALFPEPTPGLPPPGQRVVLESSLGLNVVERGSGPAVVLIHGLPGCAYDWRDLIDPLAGQGLRVLAYDRAGYGYSDTRRDGEYTVEQNARDLVGLLAALDLEDATLVGWSYGGSTSIVAAQRDASRIGRLVLVGSSGPGIEQTGPPPSFSVIASDPVITWLRAVPPVARALRRSISAVAFSGQPEPSWWLPGLGANFARPHTAATWRAEIAGLTGTVPEPTGIELPILVIHGDDDRLVPIAVGRELDRRAPSSELLVVESGSHMLPITHVRLLTERIAAFVSS